jgi:hypothetical protein
MGPTVPGGPQLAGSTTATTACATRIGDLLLLGLHVTIQWANLVLA